MALSDCRILTFPKIRDDRGNLSFIESGRHVPFDIARVYYLYDIPGEESRGAHAHRFLQQVIIAVHGFFEVELDDGHSRHAFTLRRADQGLYVPPMTWRDLRHFVSGSVCLVLASRPYESDDYFRDYQEFRQAVLAQP